MYDFLSKSFSSIFSKLLQKGTISESDISNVMTDVRRSLLEADVSLEVVESFVDKVRSAVVGKKKLSSVGAGERVAKVVHDTLIELLGSKSVPIDLQGTPPIVIMMVGLQGTGKTTTTAKLGVYLARKMKKSVLLASLDTHRPAAREQLGILGRQAGIDTLPVISDETPLQIARRAMTEARSGGYKIVLLDTAGRLHINTDLIDEVVEIKRIAAPREIMLVADCLTGQDAVAVARSFDSALGLTGIILTRMDSDARGGAAISMRYVIGKPIKFIGTGEGIDDLDTFDPERVAGRILGMGDLAALAEKANAWVSAEQRQKEEERLAKGKFDFNDMAAQLGKVSGMGGIGKLVGFLPNIGGLGDVLGSKLDETLITKQLAVISSMTKRERKNPEIIHAQRKRRIAVGSGTDVGTVNSLLKQQKQMADMIERFSKADVGVMESIKAVLSGDFRSLFGVTSGKGRRK